MKLDISHIMEPVGLPKENLQPHRDLMIGYCLLKCCGIFLTIFIYMMTWMTNAFRTHTS